eukprot:1701441-Prymnesium_polylepis.1
MNWSIESRDERQRVVGHALWTRGVLGDPPSSGHRGLDPGAVTSQWRLRDSDWRVCGAVERCLSCRVQRARCGAEGVYSVSNCALSARGPRDGARSVRLCARRRAPQRRPARGETERRARPPRT